jgi:hypothetical protein
MESPIDKKYRSLLLGRYLINALEVRHYKGHSKWQFACPFCSQTGKTEAKKKHRKAALLWDLKQNSWVFYCAKKGVLECMDAKTFGNLISSLDDTLGEAYKRERWHSWTVGKGHNCGAPQDIVGVITTTCRSTRPVHSPTSFISGQNLPVDAV